jgi:hypothetical protein
VLESRTAGFFGLNLLQDRRPQHYGELVDQSPYAPPTQVADGGHPQATWPQPGANGSTATGVPTNR